MSTLFFGVLIGVTVLIVISLVLLAWVIPSDQQDGTEEEDENGEE